VADALTPQEVAEIAARLNAATAGPWKIRQSFSTHRAGSPACNETCGRGAVPQRAWDDAAGLEELRRQGHADPRWTAEMHELPDDPMFEQILGPSGEVIFGIGQDYDDSGSAPTEANAAFIANSPTDITALLAHVSALTAARDEAPEKHVAEAEKFGYSPDPWAAEIVRLRAALLAAEQRSELYKMSLNIIASWDEGSVVTGSFDEPNAANIARNALSKDIDNSPQNG